MTYAIRRATVVCLLLAATITTVGAQPAPLRLTEDAAVRLALESNYRVRSSFVTLASTELTADTAWNTFVPSVSAGATLRRTNEETDTNPLAEPYALTGSGSVRASLTLAPSAIPEIEAARIDAVADRLGHEDLRRTIEEQVRVSFYSLLFQEEQLRVAEADVALSERTLSQTRENFSFGLTPLSTVRRSELTLATAELQRAELEAALVDSFAAFANLIGIESDTTIELIGTLETDLDTTAGAGAAPEDLTAFDPGNRTDVAEFAARISALEARERSAGVGRWSPTVVLDGTYNPTLPDPFNPDNSAHEWADRGSVSVTLSFSLDGWLPFSRTAVAQESGRLATESLRALAADARANATAEVRTLERAVANAVSGIAAQRLNEALALEILELTEEAYAAGISSFTELDEARQDLLEARLAVLGEWFDYRSSAIQLGYARGTEE